METITLIAQATTIVLLISYIKTHKRQNKEINRLQDLVQDIYKRMSAYEAGLGYLRNSVKAKEVEQHVDKTPQSGAKVPALPLKKKSKGRQAKQHDTKYGKMTIAQIAKKFKVTTKYVYNVVAEFSGNIESTISYFEKRKK